MCDDCYDSISKKCEALNYLKSKYYFEKKEDNARDRNISKCEYEYKKVDKKHQFYEKRANQGLLDICAVVKDKISFFG